MFNDENLKWDKHINFVIPKIYAKIGIIRYLRNIVNLETLNLIYNDIVQPHFDYDDTANTAKYHHSCSISGQKLWNDLPNAIQNCITLAPFKKALFTHISSKP